MSRLFLDIVGPNVRQLDFSGAMYPGLDQARAAAELLSLDLGCDVDSPWLGAEVQVRDASGARLFACPVPNLNEAA
jgi:hypothetical protein